MALEIPRYQPFSDDSRVLISEAYNLSHALKSSPDAVIHVYTCSGSALIARDVIFLKAVDNFLALKDLGYEEHARTNIYDWLINSDNQPAFIEEAA